MIDRGYLQYCVNSVQELGLRPPSEELLGDLVVSEPRLTESLVDYYIPDIAPHPDNLLDSEEQALLLDTLAVRYTGRHWPAFADDDPDFYDQLLVSMEADGWMAPKGKSEIVSVDFARLY